ncbi:MAG: hypothetical protein ACKVRP_00405, partial [Bacteroidota bacterium]
IYDDSTALQKNGSFLTYLSIKWWIKPVFFITPVLPIYSVVAQVINDVKPITYGGVFSVALSVGLFVFNGISVLIAYALHQLSVREERARVRSRENLKVATDLGFSIINVIRAFQELAKKLDLPSKPLKRIADELDQRLAKHKPPD